MRSNFKNRFKAIILTFSSLFISKKSVSVLFKKDSICVVYNFLSASYTLYHVLLRTQTEYLQWDASCFSGLHYKYKLESKLLSHRPLP